MDFEGSDIGKWKSRELSKRLAILTQTNNIQMKLTVWELVSFGRFPYSGGRTTAEDQVAALMGGFDSRVETLKTFAEGKNAIVGLCTSGGFNVLGNDGRCSIIGVEIGFENVGVDTSIDTSTHGNEASFEFIVDKNPEYIFVMDRDAAIATEGAQLAQEILENELVIGTDAYKNGRIVYLAHPAVWYTAEGGVTALDLMLADLESTLLP